MTSTQACRFKQLERIRFDERTSEVSRQRDMDFYPLAEAGKRLSTSVERLLLMAAAGTFECYVLAEGLRGTWKPAGKIDKGGEPLAPNAAETRVLVVPATACRDIEAYGSANVSQLELGLPQGGRASLCLSEPLWVNPERMLLKHPLPNIGVN